MANVVIERVAEAVSRRLARAVVTRSDPIGLGDRAAVSFTFDDIPVSAATTGAGILEARGARGTFYVCGALAGSNWDLYPLAGLDEVAGLARRGHEIGCHSAAHLDASRVGPDAYLRDVARNAAILEPVLGGGKLRSFAYPYGAIGLRLKFRLQDKFGACRGIHGGMARGSFDRGRLDAAALESASIGPDGVDALLDAAAASRAWLVFYSHDVGPAPTWFGVTPDLLAYAVDGARARGLLIDTVGGVLDRGAASRGGAHAV